MLRCFVAGIPYAFGGETAPTPPTPAMPPGDYLVIKIENIVFRSRPKIMFSSCAAKLRADALPARRMEETALLDQPNSSVPDAG